MRTLFLLFYLSVSLILTLPYLTYAAEYAATGTAYTASTEPEGNITLNQALDFALNANPEIAVALREREAIEGVKLQAATRPNPTVSTLVEDTRSATRQTTVSVEQPFELGDKRTTRMKAADVRYDAATAGFELKKADIHANVIAAFYDVLAAQERQKIAQSSLEIARQARDAASKRVQAGKISPVEETKSRVAESGAMIEANQAASTLTSARKRLTALWGNPFPRFNRAEGQVETIRAIPLLADLTALLDNAPAIKSARLEIDARQAQANIEKTRQTPDLTVSVGARRNDELNLNQAVLGLSIPIPVFDRNQGNLQEALSRTDKARDQLAALRIQLETQLAEAYERLNSARQSVRTLQDEILPGAQSAFDAASQGFAFGKFNFLDVLDAQRTLFQAKSQYISALSEAHQAEADIERILGDAMPHSEEQL